MSEKIGSLRFDLEAGVASLKSDLDAGRRMIKRYSRDFKKNIAASRAHINTMGTALTGVGVAGGAAFAAMQKQSNDFARNIVTTADRIHMSTEAFQELTYAGEKYQVTQEALVDGFKELQLRADEFAVEGAGSASEAFKRLGYSQKDVQDGLKDTDKFFQDIVRRMEDLDGAAQIRIADEIFGGQGGEQFVNLIAGGADELARMRMEARNLGLVIEDDLLRQSEQTGRQMDLLAKVVGVNLSTAMLKLGPLIQATSEELRDGLINAIDDAERDTDSFNKTAIEGFRATTDVLAVFMDGLRGMHVILKGGEVAFETMKGVALLAFEGLYRVLRGFYYNWNLFVAEPVRELGRALGKDWDFTFELNNIYEFNDLLKFSTERVMEVEDELHDLMMQELPSEGLKQSVQNIIDRMGELQEEAAKTGGAVDRSLGGDGDGANTAKLDAAGEAMQAYVDQLLAAQQEVDLFLEKQATLDELYQQGKISSEVYNDELARMGETFKQVGEEGNDTFSDLNVAITGWGSNFSSQLNDMLWESDRTFSDILRSFTKMLTQMVIQKAVVDPLLQSALGGAKPNAHGNVFSGGEIQPFAKGGVVNRPVLFPMAKGAGLMGEAGPEAIMPLKRLPGGDLGIQADMAGGGDVNVNVINQTGVAADADVRRTDSGSIEVVLTRAVSGNIARGGDIAKSLESTYGLRRKGVRR